MTEREHEKGFEILVMFCFLIWLVLQESVYFIKCHRHVHLLLLCFLYVFYSLRKKLTLETTQPKNILATPNSNWGEKNPSINIENCFFKVFKLSVNPHLIWREKKLLEGKKYFACKSWLEQILIYMVTLRNMVWIIHGLFGLIPSILKHYSI